MSFLWVLASLSLALAAPGTTGRVPDVSLDYGTFRGRSDPVTGTWNYLGMPFAEAGRFEHPRLPTFKLDGIQDATKYGSICPQRSAASIGNELGGSQAGIIVGELEEALSPAFGHQSEDCLLINVQVPQNTSSNAKLPTVMWIHGGGFEVGSSWAALGETAAFPDQTINYRPAGLVKTAIELGKPIIAVSANHRLHNFGFSASREMKEAGLLNLGIEDQRTAMQWIKKYIANFGGDPDKVTIMGESSGSWSVSAHLLWDSGDTGGLFRAAIGASGGPVTVEGPERQQATFDRMVNATGCNDVADKINCLMSADYGDIMKATNAEQSPHRLAAAGKIANVPLMIGDMRDEGTFFSQLNHLEVQTDDQFKTYFQQNWWPNASDQDMEGLMALYPQNPAAGSPFGTGILNNPTPQYKRIAALSGDFSFESQRRNLLEHYSGPAWNYLCQIDVPSGGLLPNNPLTKLPLLGSFHTFDVFFYMWANPPFTRELSKNTQNRQVTAISFISDLDPNNHGLKIPNWPQWSKGGLETYNFLESGPEVIQDNYRVEQMQYINEHADAFMI